MYAGVDWRKVTCQSVGGERSLVSGPWPRTLAALLISTLIQRETVAVAKCGVVNSHRVSVAGDGIRHGHVVGGAAVVGGGVAQWLQPPLSLIHI